MTREITTALKEQFKRTNVHKNVLLEFVNGPTIRHGQIYKESLQLTERLLQKKGFEAVGCIASVFKIKIRGAQENLKGRKFAAYIYPDGFEDQKIRIFTGIVDSVKQNSLKGYTDIIAYDELYTKGQTETANWYNSLPFPLTLKQIRNSLCNYLGLAQEETSLPNDRIVIEERQFEPGSLPAITALKSICQANGVFGIINREGLLDFRIIGRQKSQPHYPSAMTLPGSTNFPGSGPAEKIKIKSEPVGKLYKELSFEQYTVRPIEKVIIRETEDDPGRSYGIGNNKYIIQNNMWARNLPAAKQVTMARNIYENIQFEGFIPFEGKNMGMPWFEIGSPAEYEVKKNGTWQQQSFIAFNRTMTGIQFVFDAYDASGEQDQSEFITDLQAQLDAIKRTGVKLDNYYTKDETGRMIEQLEEDLITYDDLEEAIAEIETPTGFNIVSVERLPSQRTVGTVYLIRGGVIVT